jgi:TonB family protein
MIAMLLLAALAYDAAPIPHDRLDRYRKISAEGQAEPPMLAGVAVTLECTARVSGSVENCQVLGETHPGLGFGEAAVELMRDAKVTPPARDTQFAHTIQFTPS